MEVSPESEGVSSARSLVCIRRSRLASGLVFLVLVDCQTVQMPGDDGKRWRAAERIETTDVGNAFGPQVAMDAAGNAVAVWDDPDNRGDVGDDVWSNRYTQAAGWGTAEFLETDEAGDAAQAQVAMDPEGNAVAVWRQSDGTRFNVWSNRYTLDVGWGTATLVESEDEGGAEGPQVAMDAKGNAIAVWQQSDGMRENIWSNRYTPSGDWGTAEEIEDSAGNGAEPQVAVDPDGNGAAVWQQSDGVRENIWSNRYTPSEGWSTHQPIETNNIGPARFPQVAMDAGGNAVAVWQQSDGVRENIWFNHYTPAGGWGVAGLIEVDDGEATAPQVAMDPGGNAVAVWQQFDGTRVSIWSSRYTVGGSWGRVERVNSRDQGSARNPQVAMDARGIAVAVWIQPDGGRDSIWSNRYTLDVGWGTAERIVADDAGRARQPQVATDPEGNAVAVWLQSEGTTDTIWSNRLD